MARPISFKIEAPRFDQFIRDGLAKDVAVAVTAGVTGATVGAGTDLRKEIANALGVRMGNAIGWEVWPKGKASIGAAGSIFPRGEQAELILQAFTEGATIMPGGGRKALAIPTKAVPPRKGRGTGGRMSPVEVEAEFNRDLIHVPSRKPGVGLLYMQVVRARSGRGWREATVRRRQKWRVEMVLMFILVHSAHLQKRLRPETIIPRWVDRIPEFIDRNLPSN